MKRVAVVKDEPPSECTAVEASASGLTVRGRRFRFHPVFFAVFTLLFIFLSGLVFQAMGYNVMRLFVSWDDETMKVRYDAQGHFTWHDYENNLESAIDDSFFRKLEELEMMPLMPSWLPERFELERVDSKIENERNRIAVGIYSYGDRDLLIFVSKNTSSKSGGILSLEKDEREPDIFEQGGIKFYIMDNLSRGHAYWYDPPYEVEITGHVTREEIRQMINSMFERK
jgi:hypothetical protein